MPLHMPHVMTSEAHYQMPSETDAAEHEVAQLYKDAKEGNRSIKFGQTTELSHTAGKRRGRRVATVWAGDWDRATCQDTDDPAYRL